MIYVELQVETVDSVGVVLRAVSVIILWEQCVSDTTGLGLLLLVRDITKKNPINRKGFLHQSFMGRGTVNIKGHSHFISHYSL